MLDDFSQEGYGSLDRLWGFSACYPFLQVFLPRCSQSDDELLNSFDVLLPELRERGTQTVLDEPESHGDFELRDGLGGFNFLSHNLHAV